MKDEKYYFICAGLLVFFAIVLIFEAIYPGKTIIVQSNYQFYDDGFRVYVRDNNTLCRYNLSIPYNLSTAVFVDCIKETDWN